MPKTPSDKLFRLVNSLSPAEKRYFRIFIRGKTERDSKYLQLFDAIATLTVGTGTGPSTIPINVAQFQAIKARLQTFLSRTVKVK